MDKFLAYYSDVNGFYGKGKVAGWMFTLQFPDYRHHKTLPVKPTKRQLRKLTKTMRAESQEYLNS